MMNLGESDWTGEEQEESTNLKRRLTEDMADLLKPLASEAGEHFGSGKLGRGNVEEGARYG